MFLAAKRRAIDLTNATSRLAIGRRPGFSSVMLGALFCIVWIVANLDRVDGDRVSSEMRMRDCSAVKSVPRANEASAHIFTGRITACQHDVIIDAPLKALGPVRGNQTILLGFYAGLNLVEIDAFEGEGQDAGLCHLLKMVP